ncbi:hypothetical protein GCM10010233_61300 [Streptomyces pseudogriseolus]|nr:hypothetical protein GCM10010233_61300 [Streptomyces gancidicus]
MQAGRGRAGPLVGEDGDRGRPADRGDDDWYMGSLYDDGIIDWWAAYDDLYEALRGL